MHTNTAGKDVIPVRDRMHCAIMRYHCGAWLQARVAVTILLHPLLYTNYTFAVSCILFFLRHSNKILVINMQPCSKLPPLSCSLAHGWGYVCTVIRRTVRNFHSQCILECTTTLFESPFKTKWIYSGLGILYCGGPSQQTPAEVNTYIAYIHGQIFIPATSNNLPPTHPLRTVELLCMVHRSCLDHLKATVTISTPRNTRVLPITL